MDDPGDDGADLPLSVEVARLRRLLVSVAVAAEQGDHIEVLRLTSQFKKGLHP